jgi:hypothetical protein
MLNRGRGDDLAATEEDGNGRSRRGDVLPAAETVLRRDGPGQFVKRGICMPLKTEFPVKSWWYENSKTPEKHVKTVPCGRVLLPLSPPSFP